MIESKHSICRLGWGVVLLLLILSPLSFAQFTLSDVNPDTSTLDPSDPDGASGGRVNGIASVADDAMTFYAASEWGGIYKSTDGGLTWSRLNNHLANVTWDVEVNPGDTQLVYATSFHDGRVTPLSGINVSSDAGTSWTRPATATPPSSYSCASSRKNQPSAFGIAVDPSDTNDVYVGTNCGVAISNDGGSTWTFSDPTPSTSANNVWDVVVHNGGTIDICGDDGHFRSTTGGTSWVAGSGLPSGVCSIDVSPDESYVLLATVGNNIWESDDAGQSWTNLGTPDGRRQGRIPFVATNQRTDDGSTDVFDLWFGDVGLFRGRCTTPSPKAMGGALRCPTASTANPPAGLPLTGWAGSFTRSAGGHDDVGAILFDPTTSVDACPVLFSSDGGVYYNMDCHTPTWEQPDITPHGLWLWALTGADQGGDANEDVYFGLQDNGSFATTDAGAGSPSWTNRDCCDVFDTSAESARVLYTFCCTGPRATILIARGPGMTGGGGLNDPADYPADGLLPGFLFPDIIDNYANQSYVLLTRDCNPPDGIDNDGDMMIDEPDEHAGCTGVNAGDGGVYITTDITASPVTWVELGNATEPPSNASCAVKAAVQGGTPTFYVQSGRCDGRGSDNLWRFNGTAPGGTWTLVNTPGTGVSVFDVDPNNPNRLIISSLTGGNPSMFITTDGGNQWDPLPELDALMNANGLIDPSPSRGATRFTGFGGYPQPSLLAFDAEDSNIIVAGGRDSGVFVSADAGEDWQLVTRPLSPTIARPHLPRPWHAYFDHEPSNVVNVYVGTQGRGVWRVDFFRPPVTDADGPYVTNEGTDVTLDASGSTDADGGALTFAWDLDDDGTFDDAAIDMPLFDMVGQDGVFDVSVEVSDPDGAMDTDESTVTVLNVAPSVAFLTNAPKPEGDLLSLAGTATDPGWLDTLVARALWGDGTPSEILTGVLEMVRPDATLSYTGSHVYLDNLPGDAPYNLQVCVQDDDVETCESRPTVIFNVPPTVTASPDQIIFEDDPLGLPTLASFTDPGILDTHTADIDWGDGTPSEIGVVTEVDGSGTVSGDHIYPTPGVYTVTVTVTDKDGGVGADSLQVIVVHGFLRYCLFSERPDTPTSLSMFHGARALCSIGSNGGIDLKPSAHVMTDALSVEHGVFLSTDASIGGALTTETDAELGTRATIGGSVQAGGDVSLGNSAMITGSVTAGGVVSLKNKAGIAGVVTEGAILPSVPEISSVDLLLASGGGDLNVKKGQVLALAPGSYGTLTIKNGGTVQLTSGVYELDAIDIGPFGAIELDTSGGTIVVDVVGDFDSKKGSSMRIVSAGGDEEDVMVRVSGASVTLGGDGMFDGTYLALDSAINIGTGANVRGAVYGHTIDARNGVEATGDPALALFISLFLLP